jgi:hypothetical protein
MRLALESPTVIPQELRGVPCNCNANGQRTGETVSLFHLLDCPGKSVHIARHENLVGTLAFLLRSADLSVSLRDSSYGTGEKFADLFTNIAGKPVALDLTVRSTVLWRGPHISNLRKAATMPLVFSGIAEKDKRDHYEAMYNGEGADFVPFVIETPSGALGKGATAFINRLQSHVDNNHVAIAYASSFQTRHCYAAFVRQVMAAAFIRESATMIRKSLKFTARPAQASTTARGERRAGQRRL